MNTGKVSIGMPVYNDEAFLEQALESLLKQTYSHFELIISDDCSTDGSSDICRSYAARDPRITYIRQSRNLGISRNMEFVLARATGRYFMWAGDDDTWDADFILTLKNNLDAHPDAVSSFCAYAQTDEAGHLLPGRECVVEDYSDPSRIGRLLRLLRQKSDGFGYGLFIRDRIAGVRFPVWWWINRRCAYNNIYPTLCFHLTRGPYVMEKDKVLWFNRIKSSANIHHSMPFGDNAFLCYLAFALRKFNLVCFSLASICRAERGCGTACRIAPAMLYYWFLSPVFYNLRGKYKASATNKSVLM